MTKIALELPFTIVRCSCGEGRSAGGRCPRCGSVEVFPDPSVDRRRGIVALVRPLFDDPTGTRDSITPTDVFGSLGGWADQLMTACSAIMQGTEQEAVGRIGVVARSYRETADRIAATARVPQEKRVWGVVDGVMASLRSMIEEYFAAMTTADPEVCALHGTAAQRSLDAAAAIAGSL